MNKVKNDFDPHLSTSWLRFHKNNLRNIRGFFSLFRLYWTVRIKEKPKKKNPTISPPSLHMYIHRHSESLNLEIYMKGILVWPVTQLHFLSVVSCSSLLWNIHVHLILNLREKEEKQQLPYKVVREIHTY
jgi:hypothetical protein